ncbi:MAG: hypothetical protein WC476_06095 [Phycisphaerae bacterium]|jgi:hypothetical protein
MADWFEYRYGLDPLDPSDAGLDGDLDGLDNLGEYENGADPTEPDSDGDGMPDGYEVENGLNPIADDTGGDLDDDGLTNFEEFTIGTKPDNPDTDGDNLSDGDEIPIGTDPTTPDTDGDGLLDGNEIPIGTDPLDSDTDDDGSSDGDEVLVGTDPAYFDTDNDLLPDGWEVQYGLDPTASDVIDINAQGDNIYPDSDGDGLDTMKELIYNANPNMADTDEDGTSDGVEASSGGYPDDASDDGLPPSADEICELRLTVGDWSTSHSERYNLIVGPITHQAPQFGVVRSANYNQFRPGNCYEVRIVWQGCNSIGVNCGFPDYDYVAGIEAVSIPPGVTFEIEDPEGILGSHSATFDPVGCTWVDPFYAEGKVAYVNLIKVDFLSDADQKYGWDSFSSTVPWKSVKVGDTDKCVAEIGPVEKADRVYFKSLQPGNVTVSPMQASGSPQNVTLSGVAEGESQVWSRWDSVDGVDLSQLSVAAYQQDEYTLAVCVVNEEDDDEQVIPVGHGKPNQTAITAGADANLTTVPGGDDMIVETTITTGADGICNTIADVNDAQVIPTNQGKPNEICITAGVNAFRDSVPAGDDQPGGDNITTGADGICNTTADNTDEMSTDPYSEAALKDYLNNTVYNQAIVKWTTVEKLPAMTVNFDLDRDGKLDVGSICWEDEPQAIINQCDPGGYHKIVFIVNNPDHSYCGVSGKGDRYAFIFPNVSSSELITTAHELGHATFELDDLTDDGQNLMYYSDQYDGTELRKWQWYNIQQKQ